MGCDIHAFIEVKVEDKWFAYSKPRIKRNYQLFTKIAGVRRSSNEVAQLVEPQGIPKDRSLVVAIEYEREGSDAHSAGFLNREHIEELCKWTYENDLPFFEHDQLGYVSGNAVYCVGHPDNEYRSAVPDKFEEIRMIFWFDN